MKGQTLYAEPLASIKLTSICKVYSHAHQSTCATPWSAQKLFVDNLVLNQAMISYNSTCKTFKIDYRGISLPMI